MQNRVSYLLRLLKALPMVLEKIVIESTNTGHPPLTEEALNTTDKVHAQPALLINFAASSWSSVS